MDKITLSKKEFLFCLECVAECMAMGPAAGDEKEQDKALRLAEHIEASGIFTKDDKEALETIQNMRADIFRSRGQDVPYSWEEEHKEIVEQFGERFNDSRNKDKWQELPEDKSVKDFLKDDKLGG